MLRADTFHYWTHFILTEKVKPQYFYVKVGVLVLRLDISSLKVDIFHY